MTEPAPPEEPPEAPTEAGRWFRVAQLIILPVFLGVIVFNAWSRLHHRSRAESLAETIAEHRQVPLVQRQLRCETDCTGLLDMHDDAACVGACLVYDGDFVNAVQRCRSHCGDVADEPLESPEALEQCTLACVASGEIPDR